MKLDCEVIRDLLPLYADQACSEQSRALVNEHLLDCADCRDMLQKLKENEIVIFEGIHALNSMITARHLNAFKLYISARSDVEYDGKIVFKRTWFRLVRRTVRD